LGGGTNREEKDILLNFRPYGNIPTMETGKSSPQEGIDLEKGKKRGGGKKGPSILESAKRRTCLGISGEGVDHGRRKGGNHHVRDSQVGQEGG